MEVIDGRLPPTKQRDPELERIALLQDMQARYVSRLAWSVGITAFLLVNLTAGLWLLVWRFLQG